MIRRMALPVVLAAILGISAAGAADKPAAADQPAPAAKAAADKAGKAAADKSAGDKDAKAKPKMMSTTPDGKSISDSPYANGAPAITGGFTDTTQGGTHTSGDYPVAPPPPH